jgi:hypothetical protein
MTILPFSAASSDLLGLEFRLSLRSCDLF